MSRDGGNTRCPKCLGVGGFRIAGRWCRCDCTRPTPAQADLLRKFNEGDRPFNLDFLKGDRPK